MNQPRTIAAVTGTRAEYGLLRPVMRAIDAHDDLQLQVIVAGAHLLPPAHTAGEVEAEFEVAATVPMQSPEDRTRLDDAAALGRGVERFATTFGELHPDLVLVLGDRIEAYAAAAAASVGGVRVGHIHGGDRAPGLADEAMRHAITKLAHIHFAATPLSAERIICLGEWPLHVHLVGSPALDDLAQLAPLSDEQYAALGSPEIVFLLHPSGLSEEEEFTNAEKLLRRCLRAGRVLALHPNHDPGRDSILRGIESIAAEAEARLSVRPHLPRAEFIGLLRRARAIVGNSSAGLIECAALGLPCVNVGLRQSGREAPEHVISVHRWDFGDIGVALDRALAQRRGEGKHHYGDGTAGPRIARILAAFPLHQYPLSKRNSF